MGPDEAGGAGDEDGHGLQENSKSYSKARSPKPCDTLPACMRVGALAGRGRRFFERLSRRIRRVESRVVTIVPPSLDRSTGRPRAALLHSRSVSARSGAP